MGGIDEGKWLVMEGLAATADRTQVDVVSDKVTIRASRTDDRCS